MLGDPMKAGEIGEPYQLQRCVAHVSLPARAFGKRSLAFGVTHCNHAPGVQVRRTGRRLGGRDNGRELVVSDWIRSVGADRAVAQQLFDDRRHRCGDGHGVGAVAGLEKRAVVVHGIPL